MREKNSLASLFVFWTFICVGIPLLLSFLMLKAAQREWKKDASDQIHKTQIDLQAEIEDFYFDEWIPELKKLAIDGVQQIETNLLSNLLPKANIDHPIHWISYFEEQYFDYLKKVGISLNTMSKPISDLGSPIRIKIIYPEFNEPVKDLLDLRAKTIDFKYLSTKILELKSPEHRAIFEEAQLLANQFAKWNKNRLNAYEKDPLKDLQVPSEYNQLEAFLKLNWNSISKANFYNTNGFLSAYILHEGSPVNLDQKLGDVDWDVFKNLVKPVLRIILLSDTEKVSTLEYYLNLFTGLKFDKLLQEWAHLDIEPKRYQAKFQPFLTSFSEEKYETGLIHPPQFLCAILLKEYDAILILARLLNSMQKITYFSSTNEARSELTRILINDGLKPTLTSEYLDERLLEKLFTISPRPLATTTSARELFKTSEVIGAIFQGLLRLLTLKSQSMEALEMNRSQWRKQTKVEIIPSIRLPETLKKLGIYRDYNKLAHSAGNIYASYRDASGNNYSVSINDSKRIRGFTFIFTLRDDVAYYHEKVQSGIIYLTSLLAMIIALIVVFTLSRHMISPILSLTTEVSNLEPGDSYFESNLGERSDEIGQLASNFKSMNISVRHRIRELETVNHLNMKMVQGGSFDELKTLFVETTATAFQTDYVVLSFFDWIHPSITLSFKYSGVVSELLREDEIEALITGLQLHSRSQEPGVYKLPSGGQSSINSIPADSHLVVIRSEPLSSSVTNTLRTHPSVIVLVGGVTILDSDKESFIMSYATQLLSLFQQNQLQKLLVETEHGSQMQIDSMLPKVENLPEHFHLETVFIPAKYLGGDFLDAVWCPDSKVLDLVISDVSGKGMGSALLGATAKTFWKIENKRHTSLSVLFSQLNELICNENFPTLFLTLFQMRINLQTLDYEFASAGHNRMLSLCTESGKYEELSARGLPLGMLKHSAYTSKKGKFRKSDLVFLYTDGVTEMEDPDKQLFGFSQLLTTLSTNKSLNPTKLKEVLKTEFEIYRRGAPPSDDLSFIIFGSSG